jgi:hypothetical protein
MQERDAGQAAAEADSATAGAWFVVVSQGAAPRARVVEGLAAVREAVAEAVRACGRHGPAGVGDLVASLDDPGAWAAHGRGDGLPYWHWWHGWDGGALAVQRLTEAPPAAAATRAALDDAVEALSDLARALHGAVGGGGEGYVFRARRPVR